MRPALLLTSLLVLSAPAVAGEPSSACKDGATACADAWTKLDACRQKNGSQDAACAAEKAAADQACEADASACDRDGSRSPPARAGRG